MHLGAAGCDSLIFWLPLTFAKGERAHKLRGHWALDTGQYYNVSGCCCLGEHQVPDGHKAIQPAAAFSPPKPDPLGTLVAIEP